MVPHDAAKYPRPADYILALYETEVEPPKLEKNLAIGLAKYLNDERGLKMVAGAIMKEGETSPTIQWLVAEATRDLILPRSAEVQLIVGPNVQTTSDGQDQYYPSGVGLYMPASNNQPAK